MPMSVVYATVNGRMVQENRGGTITKYVADTLGSVIQTRNALGVQTSSTTYWPYGEVRTSTGNNPSPWGFVGTLGYFRDALNRLYIRARYYIANIGRWNTVDPLWPGESAFNYGLNEPVVYLDPSGLQVILGDPGTLIDGYKCCLDQAKPAQDAAAKFCKQYGLGPPADGTLCNAVQHCMWACLIAKSCGTFGGLSGAGWAKECTDLHERDAPWFWKTCPGYRQIPKDNKPHPPTSKCKDLYNNAIGINCGTSNDCYTCCVANAKPGGIEAILPPEKPGKMPPGWRKPRSGCKTNPGKVIIPATGRY